MQVGGSSSDPGRVTFHFLAGIVPELPKMADTNDPGFDQILARLREVVTRLESGELTLEQSLAIYEEGVQLARKGQQLLATAEKRVEILVSAAGKVEVVPFDDAEPKPAR
jgi:exodeoxyribonuclease VII small subunit